MEKSGVRLDKLTNGSPFVNLSSLTPETNVTAAEPELIATALDWAERGVDFADDLHLAASRECSAFVTFDAAFISTVNGLSPCVV